MRRQLREAWRVYPKAATLLLVVGWGVIELTVRLLVWTGEWTAFDATWSGWAFRICLLLVVAVVAGLMRGAVFHPAYHPGYRQWLAQAAWSGDRPLPFGPVRLIWADVLFPALLGVVGMLIEPPELATTPLLDPHVLLPVVIWLAGYNLAVWFKLSSRRGRFTCLALLPLSIFPWLSVEAALVVQVMIYVVLTVSLGREFRRFPWEEPEWTLPAHERHLAEARVQGLLGWPHHVLGPRLELPGISRRWAMAWSALAAWWVVAPLLMAGRALPRMSVHESVAGLLGADRLMSVHVLWWIFLLAVAGLRLGRYNPLRYLPSPGPLARLATGRLVVPGYDRVFVAPLLVMLFGLLGPWVMARLGIPMALVPPVAVFGVLMLAMGLGPSLENWHYTGRHRLWRQAWEPTVAAQHRGNKQMGEVQVQIGRL